MTGRTLTVDIRTEDQQTAAALKKLQREFKGLDSSMDAPRRTGLSLGNVLGGLAVGVGVRAAIGEFEEAEKSARATEAVIRSTGNAAEVSAQQQEQLVTQLSRLAGIDDEVVNGGANMLRTFTQIKGEKFGEALGASLDYAAFKGKDLASSAELIGKALNDPLTGMNKLTRAGVVFSAQQKQQIKDFMAVGDVASAQGVILQELETEYGGQAEAAATASGKMKVAFGDAAEAAGGILAPGLTAAAGAAGSASTVFQGLPPYLQASVLGFGAVAVVAKKVEDRVDNAGGSLRDLGGDLSVVDKGLIAGAAGLTAYGATLSALQASIKFDGDVSGLGEDLAALGEGAIAPSEAVTELGGSIESLADKFKKASGDSLGKRLTSGPFEIQRIRDANEALGALDEQLAELASNDPAAASAAVLALTDALEGQGVSQQQVLAQLPQYGAALKRATRDGQDQKKTSDEQAGALDALAPTVDVLTEKWVAHATAIEKVNTETEKLLGAAFDEFQANEKYEQSVSAVTAAQAELALIRKKGDPTEIKDAENKLNDAIVDQVQAKGDQATATAEANGQSLTAAQVAAIQRGELINLRETTGAYTTDLDVLLVRLTQVTNQYGAATEAVKAHERALAAAKNDEANGPAPLPGTPGSTVPPTRDPDSGPRRSNRGVTIHAPNLRTVAPGKKQLDTALNRASKWQAGSQSVMVP